MEMDPRIEAQMGWIGNPSVTAQYDVTGTAYAPAAGSEGLVTLILRPAVYLDPLVCAVTHALGGRENR
jgi:hypothetical protein